MRIAMMQPYFLPYIGYFQLIETVDTFVFFDDIQYRKKTWINRNRILLNGRPAWIILPLKMNAEPKINEKIISDDFDSKKLLRRIDIAYRRASQFESLFPIITKVIEFDDKRLSGFLYNSLIEVCKLLDIRTPIVKSSELLGSKSTGRVTRILNCCKEVGASTYVNSIGGLTLYSKEEFTSHGIDLKFLRPKPFEYRQFGNDFVPSLSILDVLMFNTTEQTRYQVTTGYDLL